MILKFKQTDRENHHEFIVVDNNGKTFCKGITQTNAYKIASTAVFKNERFSLYGDFHRNIKEEPMVEKSEMKGFYTENEYMNANRASFLDEHNSVIGKIKRKRVETKVLWAEKYVFSFYEANYSGYYIAKPLQGLYYFIVDENMKTVAAIKQNAHAVNYYFGYKIYVENEYFAKMAVLFLIYADNHKYGGKWTYSGINITGETTLVAQPKEVKERFDSAFIKRIKELD